MECLHCQGIMQQGVAPFQVNRNGYHVSWDAIPAWVCPECGEPLFEATEVEKIQAALMALDKTVIHTPSKHLDQDVA